jgi:hypothetical protein
MPARRASRIASRGSSGAVEAQGPQVLRQVTAATYHQVWWPAHDELVYDGGHLPVWEEGRFVDPDTRQPVTAWAEAAAAVEDPSHVVTFGRQVHSKGILGGGEEAGRHIGYLTKYLTKATGEVITADTDRQRAHHDRLHDELKLTPCSPRCAVWLLYGIEPPRRDQADASGPVQGAGTPTHHARAAGSAGARVAEVVGEDPRRPSG